jgi:hypothetical protein
MKRRIFEIIERAREGDLPIWDRKNKPAPTVGKRLSRGTMRPVQKRKALAGLGGKFPGV